MKVKRCAYKIVSILEMVQVRLVNLREPLR